MEQKSDWNYLYCQTLEQQIAINRETNVLYTEDKTRYSPEETRLLCRINYNIPKSVHIIKKLFNGTIISL